MQSTADLLGVKFNFKHLGCNKGAITEPKISSDLCFSFPVHCTMEGKNNNFKIYRVNKKNSQRKIFKICPEPSCLRNQILNSSSEPASVNAAESNSIHAPNI